MNNKTTDPVRKFETVYILGIPIAVAKMSAALDYVQHCIDLKQQIQIGVVNAAKVVNMRRKPELFQDVLSSDIIFADGMSIVWASRWLKKPLPERIAGIDLMMGLMERANKRGYRVFFLGATEEVSKEVERRTKLEFPGLVFAGRRNGYFKKDEEAAVAQEIRDAQADILFVAMTSPKKENFLAKWSGFINATVSHGVGGSFDVYSGKVQRAPVSWQRLGLEWFYRFKQEPVRLFGRYFVTNTLFLSMVLQELFMNLARIEKLPKNS